jgi:hypothetical protein
MRIPETLKWNHTGNALGQGGQAQILEVIDKTADSAQLYAMKVLRKGKPRQAYDRFYRSGLAYFECNHCGFYFAQNKSKYDKSVERGGPAFSWIGRSGQQ